MNHCVTGHKNVPICVSYQMATIHDANNVTYKKDLLLWMPRVKNSTRIPSGFQVVAFALYPIFKRNQSPQSSTHFLSKLLIF